MKPHYRVGDRIQHLRQPDVIGNVIRLNPKTYAPIIFCECNNCKGKTELYCSIADYKLIKCVVVDTFEQDGEE